MNMMKIRAETRFADRMGRGREDALRLKEGKVLGRNCSPCRARKRVVFRSRGCPWYKDVQNVSNAMLLPYMRHKISVKLLEYLTQPWMENGVIQHRKALFHCEGYFPGLS
jgi:hypothetical protein